MTEPRNNLYLRRLRFSPELEREFQQEYARRFLGHVRIGAALFLFLFFVVQGIADIVWPTLPLRPLLFYRYGFLLPFSVAALLFTYSPVYLRLMQPFQFLWTLAVGGYFILYRAVYPLNLQMDWPRWILLEFTGGFTLTFVLLAAYTLSRLQFLYAVAVSWSLIIGYEFAGLYANHWQNLISPTVTVDLLIANLFATCVGYLIERSVRENFLLTRELEAEQQRSEALLLNILPRSIAERLKQTATTVADRFPEVTVLFADIVDFTPLAARLSPEEVVGLLNELFSTFDALAERHGLEKIKTIGDAYMVVGGLPEPRADHAEAIAEMALAMREAMAQWSAEKAQPLSIRIGINTGPVVAGVIGTKKFIYDLWGDTVNLAGRMESQGMADCIQVTAATYERLREKYLFEERGRIPVRGLGEMVTYLLIQRKAALPASIRPRPQPLIPQGMG